MSEVYPLFATPFYFDFITPLDKQTIEFCKAMPRELMASELSYYSLDKQVLELPELKKLKQEILQHTNIFVYDILKVQKNISFYLTTSWVVTCDLNQKTLNHTHPNSILSGVIYLDAESNSGDLVLAKDHSRPTIFPTCFDIKFEEYNPFNATEFSIPPVNNRIVIFPSHVNHFIKPNLSDKPRYSLAFNFFIKGYLGDKENALAL